MEPEIQTIDYQIGTTKLFMPKHLKMVKVILSEFTISNLMGKIKKSKVASIGAMEIICGGFFKLDNDEKSDQHQKYQQLTSVFPRLKFFRIIYLIDQDNASDQEFEEVPFLMKGLRSLQNVEIFHKDVEMFSQMRAEQEYKNIKLIKIENTRAPLVLKQQGVIPETTEKELTAVDHTHLNKEQEHLKYVPKIKEWQCLKLASYEEESQEPLKAIKDINFPYLLQLSFCSCSIDSLESLTYLRALILDYLLLGNNNITNIQSLRKMNLTEVYQLDLQSNTFQEAECLSQVYWSKSIYLNLSTYDENDNQIPSLSSIAKICVVNLEISFYSDKKIKEESVRKKIEQNRVDLRVK